jgi:outer membrane lipoprotein carrier protein
MFRIFLLFVLSLFSVSGWCLTEEELSSVLSSSDHFKADFYQQVIDADDVIIQEASGFFALKKPGRFKWHYKSPISQQIVADGRNLWMFDIDLAQVTVQPIDDALGSAPIMLLTENKPLAEDFEIREMSMAFGLKWIALVPRIKDTEFYRIEIGVDGEDIREMKLYDHFDQTTVIRFSNIQYDAMLDDSNFKFVIPQGVDVVGEPQ